LIPPQIQLFNNLFSILSNSIDDSIISCGWSKFQHFHSNSVSGQCLSRECWLPSRRTNCSSAQKTQLLCLKSLSVLYGLERGMIRPIHSFTSFSVGSLLRNATNFWLLTAFSASLRSNIWRYQCRRRNYWHILKFWGSSFNSKVQCLMRLRCCYLYKKWVTYVKHFQMRQRSQCFNRVYSYPTLVLLYFNHKLPMFKHFRCGSCGRAETKLS